MRRIFPRNSSTKEDSGRGLYPGKKEDLSRIKPLRKERPPAAAAAVAAAALSGSKNQESSRQSSISERSRRSHWCPSCPSSGITGNERCETPPSGDENAASVARRDAPREEIEIEHPVAEATSQFRLGLPDECQDKEILRPSIKAALPENYEWSSGLQEALDQLMIESRKELCSKFGSEPPSPLSTSPPPPSSLVEDSNSRPSSTSSGMSHSVDFQPRPKLSRSLSRSSNDGASIMSNPRSQSFSEWSSRGGAMVTTSNSDKAQRYLSARAVAERLAKAIRGNSKARDVKRSLPPVPQTPPRSSESIASYSVNRSGGASGKQQQQIVDGLQQSLSDMTHAMNTQNSRIQRLTGRNEELYRLYRSKEKELMELQAKAKEDEEKRKVRDDELRQVKDKLKYLQEKIQAQSNASSEAARLRRLLADATERISELELQVKEKNEKLGVANSDLRRSLQELNRYREEMPRVIRQRDGMKEEAEQLGHEALRMSAEAEVLKRRVHELEEEVMIRDGHLSILRGTISNNYDC